MTDAPAPPLLRHTVLDCEDPRALAEFYRALLGLRYRPGHEPPPAGEPDEAGDDWLVLRSAEGPGLAFQKVEHLTPPTWPDDAVPQQLHLDLTVPDFAALEHGRDRVLELGGRLLLDRSEDPDEALYVFADPAGHPFCIFTWGT